MRCWQKWGKNSFHVFQNIYFSGLSLGSVGGLCYSFLLKVKKKAISEGYIFGVVHCYNVIHGFYIDFKVHIDFLAGHGNRALDIFFSVSLQAS